jgi:hypothetical protein
MRLHFVLLTKCYDAFDLKYWFAYHRARFPAASFHVFDNDSLVDVRLAMGDMPYHYTHISGFPDQKRLYSDIMNGKYGSLFEDGDAVAFIDDDEYLYVRDANSGKFVLPLESLISECFGQYDSLCIPHINMSSQELAGDRDTRIPMPENFTYRRNDGATTVKCIVKYCQGKTYTWKRTETDGAGHVPYVNGRRNAAVFTGWFPKDASGNIVPDRIETLSFPLHDSIAAVDYSSNVRLYHYHIKSRWDWDQKIARGSCSSVVPWYADEIEKNIFYGNYDIPDGDMKAEYLRVAGKGDTVTGSREHDRWYDIHENDTVTRKHNFTDTGKVTYETIRFATTFDEKIALGKKWISENAPHISLDEPKNICDWINFYKFNDLNPQKVAWTDKCAVYKELYDLGLENLRMPVMYERYKPSDVDIVEALRMCRNNDCILKCNHGSGFNIRFKAGDSINEEYLAKKIRGWLDTNYAYVAGYEWQYEPIVPAILVQPTVSAATPVDYQFFCLDGEVVAVELQRKVSKVLITHIAFVDTDGNDLDWYIGGTPLQRNLSTEQRNAMEHMLPAVREISKLFKFVRVDMLWTGHRGYFCETTFCPCSGVLDYVKR